MEMSRPIKALYSMYFELLLYASIAEEKWQAGGNVYLNYGTILFSSKAS